MLKKVIKLLVVFVLMVQIISPVITASANEGIESTNLIDDLTDQLEISETEDITPEIEVEETEVDKNQLKIDLEEDIADEIDVEIDIEEIDIEIKDELDEEELNEAIVVWTIEELTFFDELWSRFYDACNEAWDLFFYIENMYSAGTLMAHPNGAELYRLLNAFDDGVDALATSTWIDITLPFDHELNMAYLAKMNTFIEFFESFIAELTTSLDVVILEVEERNSSDNNDNENDNNSNNENNNSNSDNNNNTLPQTGTDVALNTMLAGSGLAALGGLITYQKIKKD